MKDELRYEYDPQSVNEVVDSTEGTGNYIALRKVRWNPNAEFKYDIRKYFVKSDGTEVAGKGFSFMSEEGPDTLTEVMVGNGFGNTDSLVNLLMGRGEEFVTALARATQLNSQDFLRDFNMCLSEVTKEEQNKPVNAKEMLGKLL